MWINKKTGTMHGRLGDKVYYVRYGKQYVRELAGRHTIKTSRAARDIRMWVSEASDLWRELPDSVRWQWERYAKMLGSPSDIESAVGHIRHCPLPNYPSRPKLMDGKAAFVGSYVVAKRCGLEGLRALAPTGIPVPPTPIIECEYERASGRLIVRIDTPELVRSISYYDRKLLLWATITSHGKPIINKRLLDVVDMPARPTRLELSYEEIRRTQKPFGYKPLVFAKLDYMIVDIAAQTLITTSPTRAAVISAISNVEHFYILNERRMVGLEDLIKQGKVIRIANVRWSKKFMSRVAKLRVL